MSAVDHERWVLTRMLLRWYRFVDGYAGESYSVVSDAWMNVDSEDEARKELHGIAAFDEEDGLYPSPEEVWRSDHCHNLSFAGIVYYGAMHGGWSQR